MKVKKADRLEILPYKSLVKELNKCDKQIVLKCPPKELIAAINKKKIEIMTNNPHRRGVVSNTEAVLKLIKGRD